MLYSYLGLSGSYMWCLNSCYYSMRVLRIGIILLFLPSGEDLEFQVQFDILFPPVKCILFLESHIQSIEGAYSSSHSRCRTEIQSSCSILCRMCVETQWGCGNNLLVSHSVGEHIKIGFSCLIVKQSYTRSIPYSKTVSMLTLSCVARQGQQLSLVLCACL